MRSVDRRWSGLTVSFLLKPAHKRSGWNPFNCHLYSVSVSLIQFSEKSNPLSLFQVLFPWSGFSKKLDLWFLFQVGFPWSSFSNNLIFDSYFRFCFIDPVSPKNWSLIFFRLVSLIQFPKETWSLIPFSGFFCFIDPFLQGPNPISGSVSLIQFLQKLIPKPFQVLFLWSSFPKKPRL